MGAPRPAAKSAPGPAPPASAKPAKPAKTGKAGARSAPVSGLLRAAAAKVLADAQAAATAAPAQPTDRVHRVRVCLKRLRTYWRLARPHVAPVAWARERDRLRALAAALAAHRDAAVARAVVEAHLGRTGDAALRSLLQRWVESKRALAGPPAGLERVIRAVARRMATTAPKLERAGGGAVTWDWLAPGLDRTYRRGKQAWRRCRNRGGDAEFHLWRRRVKDLQYQLELLRFLAPHRLGKLRHRVQGVADALGEAHDLVEVRDALERAFAAVRHPGGSPAARHERWSGALSRNRRALLEGIRRRMDANYQTALREAQAVFAAAAKDWLNTLRNDWRRRQDAPAAARKKPTGSGGKMT
jgi:CHAD domain-containing protein